MKSHHNAIAPHGFTSIEVLAATTLAALLMASVLGVLSGIAKHGRLLEDTAGPPEWHDLAALQFESDLQVASACQTGPKEIVLTTFSDGDSRRPTWLPGTIRYSIVENGSKPLLLREEGARIRVSSDANREILCVGVDGVALCLPQQTPGEPVSQSTIPSGPLPNQIRVVLTSEGKAVMNRLVIRY